MRLIRRNWKSVFAWSYMKNDFTKHVILFLSCLVALSSLLLTIGFYSGSNQAIDEAKNSLVDSFNYQISVKEYHDSSHSPIRLVRTSRPALEEIGFLSTAVPSVIISNDYQNLFPGDYRLQSGNKDVVGMSFIPIYSFTLMEQRRHLLMQGKIPSGESINDICINEEGLKTLGIDITSAIGHKLDLFIKTKISLAFNDATISDVFYYDGQLRICAVFKELTFLNTPRIFFSQSALETLLANHLLEDVSEVRETPTTCLDLFMILDNNHPLLNFQLRVFAADLIDIDLLDKMGELLRQNNSRFTLFSDASSLIKTYQQLTTASFYSMLVFAVIAMVGTCSIMAIGSFSNYVFNKKDSAILSCLGARKSDIRNIFINQTALILSVSAIVSLFVAWFLKQCLNELLIDMFGSGTMIDIPYASFCNVLFGLPLMIVALAVVVSVIFTTIPLALYKSRPILDELRDA